MIFYKLGVGGSSRDRVKKSNFSSICFQKIEATTVDKMTAR